MQRHPCRNELLDRTLIWNQTHLIHALREYERHHNQHRPHRGIANTRPLQPLPEPTTEPAPTTSTATTGHRDPAWAPARAIRIGRERVRRILHEHDISFQRTRTWKTSADPAYDAKLDRIDEVMSRFPDRCFAFGQFGPLSIRPCHGTCWQAWKHPDRLPATNRHTHGIRYFHGCYSPSEDRLWGVLHEHKGGAHTLAAFKTIRAARPDGAPIYIICDNLSVNTTPRFGRGPRRTRSSCA